MTYMWIIYSILVFVLPFFIAWLLYKAGKKHIKNKRLYATKALEKQKELEEQQRLKKIEEDKKYEELIKLEVQTEKQFDERYGTKDTIISRVVGVFYRSDEDKEKAMSVELGDILTLRRDRNNKYDSNAVKVYSNSHHIGFIPKEDAYGLANLMDLGSNVMAVVIHSSNAASINDDIYISIKIYVKKSS